MRHYLRAEATMPLGWVRSLAMAALLCAVPAGMDRARSQSADSVGSPEAFTARVAALFREVSPDFAVTTVAPLRLSVKSEHGAQGVYLDRIYGVCLNDPPHCEPSLLRLVAATAMNLRSPNSPTTISDLRITVRPMVYVDQIARLAGEPVAEPLVDDLWTVLVADRPTEITTLTAKSLAPLGLDGDHALAQARRNLSERFARALLLGLDRMENGHMTLRGNDYLSSLLALPELWRPIARAFDGRLYVAIPGVDVLIFEDARRPGALSDMLQRVETEGRKAQRRISPAVFEWKPTGWVVAARSSAWTP